jgi:ABC-type lipoprotein export system ATPase subunit
MSTNKEFAKKLRDAKTQWARFCLCDFHVHSPASYDVRRPGRFEELKPDEQEMLKDVPVPNNSTDLAAHEKAVISAYPPKKFYDFLVVRKNKIATDLGLSDAEDWGIVAVTDHNVCEYSSKVSVQAWNNKDTNRLIVLPAVELDVSFPVNGIDDCVSIHLLVLFQPCTSDSDIRIAIHDASGVNWKAGDKSLTVSNLDTFVSTLRNSSAYPAICIAAHVSSSKGVQAETKKKLLSSTEAEIAALESSKSAVDADNEKIEEQLNHLKTTVQTEIPVNVLKLIGACGFDALQVVNTEDEKHYRSLHRFRDELGRAVPIVCSDAHTSLNVFDAGNGMVPHLKICWIPSSETDWFNEIRNAIRCGETRFTDIAPGRVSNWIEGIEVIPDAEDAVDFWPSPSDEGLILPLSRNLNCLIGGRGSGKSAVIEALGFITQPEDYKLTPKQREEREYYRRAKATINGCSIKVCWKSNSSNGDSAIPKKGLFSLRYFDPKDSHQDTEYRGVDEKTIPLTSEPSVQLYRFKEIEEIANASGLRKLFDDICGKEVSNLSAEIDRLVQALIDQRSSVIEKARVISMLTDDDAPLRKYVSAIMDYRKANKPEVQSHYEALDQIEFAGKSIASFLEEWEEIRKGFGFDAAKGTIEHFFAQLKDKCYDKEGNLLPYLVHLAKLLEEDEEDIRFKKEVLEALDAAEKKICSGEDVLKEIRDQLRSKHKSEKDTLSSKGLPTGGKDREAKKAAFEEAKSALEKYQNAVQEYDLACSQREELFTKLINLCKRKTELRDQTACKITEQLSKDLDGNVLMIEALAQGMADKRNFVKWMDKHVAPLFSRYRPQRLTALIDESLMPSKLRELLHGEGDNVSILTTNKDRASDGQITDAEAEEIFDAIKARIKLDPEVLEQDVEPEVWNELPTEIKEGLWTFPPDKSSQHKLRLEHVLELDEIVLDDIPVIKLNDRPWDEGSKPRPLENLSPGQRCSAILPILLLNGDDPLIIDQPEDNLDNRLIRQVIVNVLASIKLRRQVIVATHNPNLPVLGDAEQTIALKAIDENKSELEAFGNLDQADIIRKITDIMEGGREAFQYRQSIYQHHWKGHVDSH